MLPTRKITSAERAALELRFDGPIPRQYLEPVLDLPTTREGLCDLLAELGAELEAARAKPLNDVPVAILSREMATVRAAIDALPAQQLAAE